MQERILVYGENWEGTLPQLLLTDLKSRNFEVKSFDYTLIMPGIRKRSFFEKVIRKIFYRFYINKINKDLLKTVQVFNPSMIIVAKGIHLSQFTLLCMRSKSVKLINWNPDDFFNMKNSNDNLISSLDLYDLIISSRPHMFDKYYQHGAKDVLFIDWYYVPSLHFAEDLEKTIDISFVGSWSQYREDFIDSIGKRFIIRGGGWEKSSSKFKSRHNVDSKILSQLEMREIFNKSKINLNILTPENFDISNLRFFEVPASGGLLLTERNSHALSLLLDKEECLMFSSVTEIQMLLSEWSDSNKIARSGTHRMLTSLHSFHDRVDDMLRHVNNAE